MKRLKIILLSLIAFALMATMATTATVATMATVQQPQQPLKVAIFDPIGELPSGFNILIREKISNIVTKSANYRAVERSLIDKVLEENKFQAKGFVDESQLSKMGRKAGADVVCLTIVTSPDAYHYHVSCKIINYNTSHIQKQRTRQTLAEAGNLENIIVELATELFIDKKK
jgi:hypothetical protein